MNKENTEKLLKTAPLLYGDYNAPMITTAMCWGFECNEGWFSILYDLSVKLEALIKKYYDENKEKVRCRACNCKRQKHYAHGTDRPGKCLAVHKRPHTLFEPRWRPNKGWNRVMRLVNKLYGSLSYELETCYCDIFDPSISRASQVKEKYGTLRFYMTTSSDEMEKLIDVAEKLSETTCELCGMPGSLRDDCGWYKTRCDSCWNKEGERWTN